MSEQSSKPRRNAPSLRKRLDQVEAELRLRTEERDRALQELEAAREKQRAGDDVFRRFSDSGIIGIALFELSGIILYANDALLKMIGATAEDLAGGGVRWDHFIAPESADAAARAMDELTSNSICAPFEQQFQRADGFRFWGLFVAVGLENSTSAMAFVVDITESKVAGEALRLSRERLDLVQRSIDLGVWYCDLPFDRLIWNESCKRHFGLPSDAEVTIGLFYELIHPDDRDQTREAIERAIADQTPFDVEYRTLGPDGLLRWVRAMGSAFYDNTGTPSRFDGITIDVSERRQALIQLAESDRRKDEFLAMLAHELRNPLASIITTMEILSQRGSAEDHPTRLRSIVDRQAQHLSHLVNDLLDVARVTQGKINLWRQTLDLAQAVQSAVETCRHAIDLRRQDLTVELPNVPLCVNADPARLEQVICNLLNNAARYTGIGGHISVRVERENDDALLEVRDTGIGIPSEMLTRIFDLFAQVDPALDRSDSGLGIGLTLVRKIVELHGGSVVAQSPGPGHGSSFLVRLPCVETIGVDPAPDLPLNQRDAPSGSSRRVLVVEDNVDAAECLKELLELWGHEVQVVHNGLAALKAAAEFRPDLVLCDIGLPGMDGYQVARQIRNQPDLREMQLVAVTGYGDAGDVRRSHEAGFDRHVVKPVDPAELERLAAGI